MYILESTQASSQVGISELTQAVALLGSHCVYVSESTYTVVSVRILMYISQNSHKL